MTDRPTATRHGPTVNGQDDSQGSYTFKINKDGRTDKLATKVSLPHVMEDEWSPKEIFLTIVCIGVNMKQFESQYTITSRNADGIDKCSEEN